MIRILVEKIFSVNFPGLSGIATGRPNALEFEGRSSTEVQLLNQLVGFVVSSTDVTVVRVQMHECEQAVSVSDGRN